MLVWLAKEAVSPASPASLSLWHCVLNQDRLSYFQEQSPWLSSSAQQKFVSSWCFICCISVSKLCSHPKTMDGDATTGNIQKL